jgi:hypothetical protein
VKVRFKSEETLVVVVVVVVAAVVVVITTKNFLCIVTADSCPPMSAL